MNNFLPFTIEAYERGEEVVYRNGEKPDEIHLFKTAINSPILTVDSGAICKHNVDGSSTTYPEYDLFIKPKTIEKFRNEYVNGAGKWFDAIEEAESGQGFGVIRVCMSKGTFSGDKLISIEIVTPQSTDNG